AIGFIEEARLRAPAAVGNPVQRARAAHELQDLVADAMHVDGERDAAEADQRNAQFLLAQRSTPKGLFPELFTTPAMSQGISGTQNPTIPEHRTAIQGCRNRHPLERRLYPVN